MRAAPTLLAPGHGWRCWAWLVSGHGWSQAGMEALARRPFHGSLRPLSAFHLFLGEVTAGGFLGEMPAHPPARPLQISQQRGMQADPGALAALCEKTDNDIRACINALQVGGGRGRLEVGGSQPSPDVQCLWEVVRPSRPAPHVQFLHGRGRRKLSIQVVQTTRVGLKDQRKGLFSVWQEVFQLPRAQR